MRSPIPPALPPVALVCLGLSGLVSPPALGETPPDAEGVRRAWHRCVRQAFSGQPASLGKQAAERAALAACRDLEDRTVAAELAARHERSADASATETLGPTSRARAWIASAAASVVDPVAAWFGRLVR